MLRNWAKLTILPVLAAALWLAGCSDLAAPTEPPLAAPEASTSFIPTPSERLAGSIPAFDVSKTIGPEGGSLGITGYTMTVPRNAVAQPTVFTFTSATNGYVQVKATATAVGSSDPNDVGRAGFDTPVLISLSYDSAGGLPKWLKLVLAYVAPDGQLEYVPSSINVVKKVVTGAVTHFSDYALALP